MHRFDFGVRRRRPSLWVAASYGVLAVGICAFFLVAWTALRVVTFSRNLMEMEAEWSRSRAGAVLHLQSYALSGAPEEWEAYEESVRYIRAVRPSMEAAVAYPGDADRIREALASDSLTAPRADYWADIFEEYGAEPEVIEVARDRLQRSRIMETVEELAEELRGAVEAEGPATPSAIDVARRIRAANAEIETLADPFWQGVLEWAEEQERGTFRALVGAGLLILLGGVLVVTGAARRSRRWEEALIESETRFRQVAENIREVFWLTDPEKSRMLYVSPGFEEIWGRPVEELHQDAGAWMESVHPDDRDKVRARLSDQARGRYDLEYRIVREDGSIRWIRDRAFPVEDEEGNVFRIAGIAEDITARRELEREVVEAQKLKAVGRLAGGIGHEFNNLLMVVRGHLDLLTFGREGDPELQREVAGARDAAQEAGNLIRRLLSFAGRQMLTPRSLDLSAFVRKTAEMVRRDLPPGVDLRIRADDPVPVRADPAHLRDVLLTLITSSRDRLVADGPIGEGGIVVETRTAVTEEGRDVHGGELPAGRWGVLEITYDGEPIPEDELSRLFEPFGAISEEEGLRLGLASVYGLVHQSGGGLDVVSSSGEGTRFTVYLPGGDPAENSETTPPEPPTSFGSSLPLPR